MIIHEDTERARALVSGMETSDVAALIAALIQGHQLEKDYSSEGLYSALLSLICETIDDEPERAVGVFNYLADHEDPAVRRMVFWLQDVMWHPKAEQIEARYWRMLAGDPDPEVRRMLISPVTECLQEGSLEGNRERQLAWLLDGIDARNWAEWYPRPATTE